MGLRKIPRRARPAPGRSAARTRAAAPITLPEAAAPVVSTTATGGAAPSPEAAAGAARETLTGAAIGRLADETAALAATLGIDDPAWTDPARATPVVVEPDAVELAGVLRHALAGDHAAAGAGVTAEEIDGLLAQQAEVRAAEAAAAQLDRDLGDTDRAAARKEREAIDELGRLVDGLLAEGALEPAQQDRLRADAAELLGLRAAERAAVAAERARTGTGKAAHGAALSTLEGEKLLLRTMIALRTDQPVEARALEAALAVYEQLTAPAP